MLLIWRGIDPFACVVDEHGCSETLACRFCVAQGQICGRDPGSELHPVPPSWDWIRSLGGSHEEPPWLHPQAGTHWGLPALAGSHPPLSSPQKQLCMGRGRKRMLNAFCFPPKTSDWRCVTPADVPADTSPNPVRLLQQLHPQLCRSARAVLTVGVFSCWERAHLPHICAAFQFKLNPISKTQTCVWWLRERNTLTCVVNICVENRKICDSDSGFN